jgi:hypothetical protein
MIGRCYHLDSANNDCIQCCDLLLGAISLARNDPFVRLQNPDLKQKFGKGEKLRDSEVKRLIAGHLALKIDTDGGCVYDLR